MYSLIFLLLLFYIYTQSWIYREMFADKLKEKLKNKIIIVNIKLDVFLSLCLTGRRFGSFYLRLNVNSNCHLVYIYIYHVLLLLLLLFSLSFLSCSHAFYWQRERKKQLMKHANVCKVCLCSMYRMEWNQCQSSDAACSKARARTHTCAWSHTITCCQKQSICTLVQINGNAGNDICHMHARFWVDVSVQYQIFYVQPCCSGNCRKSTTRGAKIRNNTHLLNKSNNWE